MTQHARTKGRPPADAQGPASGAVERNNVLTMRGSPAYAKWFDDAHWETRLPKSTIIRDALREWAERRELPPPPVI